MSVLTDYFTSLANKIRSRLGTSTTYTPVEAINAIDDVYNKGVIDTKIGTATAEDVKSGKTFTNSSGIGIGGTLSLSGDAAVGNVLSGKTFYNNSWTKQTGTMTNNGAVSQSLNCGGSYTVPAGYHNGSGKVTANSLASQTGVDSGKTAAGVGQIVSGYQAWVNGSKITGTFAGQEKTVTAGTSAASVTPDSGKYLTKVTYNPTPSQSKSASPSTSAQTISPDSGKLLSSVSISAISPQRTAGTAAYSSGVDSTGPYVYFPYGWYPSNGNGYQYIRMTAAQAVAACPSQSKSASSSTAAQTIYPDSGKLLSSVSISAISPQRSSGIACTGAGINATAPFVYFPYGYYDINWNNSAFCYLTAEQAQAVHSHGGTITPTSNSSAYDMGSIHSYRYINTTTVYNLGIAQGADHIKSNSDIKTALCISGSSGDWVSIGDRKFTRTSSALAWITASYSTSGNFVQYTLISMDAAAMNGYYTEYGQLAATQTATSPSGKTYYMGLMDNALPKDAYNYTMFRAEINRVPTIPIWINSSTKSATWYNAVGSFVDDVLSKI